jgi:HlyD family secretion protein
MRIGRFILAFFSCILISCGQQSQDHYQGYVEGELIFLTSPYSGVLEKLFVKRGETVKKGALIFKLAQYPEILKIKEAEAELTQSKKVHQDLQNPRRSPEIAAIHEEIEQIDAKIKLAQLQVERFRKLYEKNAASKENVDQAVSQYEELQHAKTEQLAHLDLAKQGSRKEQIDAQQAQIEAVTARLQQVQWQLEQKTLAAPVDGVVFDTYYRPGEFVPGQQAVAALLSPNNVRIEFFIPANKLASLHLGQGISFTCDGCETSSPAKISYISPEAEYIPPLVYSRENQNKLVFRIKADISSPNKFKPGQPVMVDVQK